MKAALLDVIVSPVEILLAGGWRLLAVLLLLVVAVTLVILWVRRTGRK